MFSYFALQYNYFNIVFFMVNSIHNRRKTFQKKEYSDCQVRRGKSNVAVGLQLYGPSVAQLIATLISR